MPVPAERTAVGGALAGHAREERGVEGVALRAIAAFANALVSALLGGGFLHGRVDFHRAHGESQPGADFPSPARATTR